MILEKGKYILLTSYGGGRHFICGPHISKVTDASKEAIRKQDRYSKLKSNRAPSVRVSVLRIVEVYDRKA